MKCTCFTPPLKRNPHQPTCPLYEGQARSDLRPLLVQQHHRTLDSIEREWAKDRQRIKNQADVIETYQQERARDALGGQAALDESNNTINGLRHEKADLERLNENLRVRVKHLEARITEMHFELRRFYEARDAISTANALLQEALKKEGGEG